MSTIPYSRGPREPRRNQQIRVKEVRLVGDAGEQIGVVPTEEAIRRAQDAGFDLVEVAPTARPPVCKIMDYGKYKYRMKKKQHEAKKHQTVIQLKEIKMRPTTEEHDLQFRVDSIRRFLSEKNKAKVTIVFRGREMAYADRARVLMDRVVKMVEAEGKVEMEPKKRGKR